MKSLTHQSRLGYDVGASDLKNLNGLQPQRVISYSCYMYVAGCPKLCSMISPLWVPGWQSNVYLGHYQRHSKSYVGALSSSGKKFMLLSPTLHWPKNVIWQILTLMGLGSRIVHQVKVSNACEQSITVSITYSNLMMYLLLLGGGLWNSSFLVFLKERIQLRDLIES